MHLLLELSMKWPEDASYANASLLLGTHVHVLTSAPSLFDAPFTSRHCPLNSDLKFVGSVEEELADPQPKIWAAKVSLKPEPPPL